MHRRLRVITDHLCPRRILPNSNKCNTNTTHITTNIHHAHISHNHCISSFSSTLRNIQTQSTSTTTTTTNTTNTDSTTTTTTTSDDLNQLVRHYFHNVKSFIEGSGESKFYFWSSTVDNIPTNTNANTTNTYTATLLSRIEQRKALPQPLLSHEIKIPDEIISKLCNLYVTLSLDEKQKFFQVMSVEFGVNEDHIWNEVQKLMMDKKRRNMTSSSSSDNDDEDDGDSDGGPIVDFQHLRKAMVPLYEQFFDYLIKQPNGMQFVLGMRSDLLRIIQQNKTRTNVSATARDHHWSQVITMDQNLQTVLGSWFSLAFLRLEELTWNSPIAMLEKVMSGERVHRFGDLDPNINLSDRWQDLKRRVAQCSYYHSPSDGPSSYGRGSDDGSDGSSRRSQPVSRRRLFCFVHPNMSHEPLIFVQVAYLDHIPMRMSQVLPRSDAEYYENPVNRATTAVFYSINATQHGLRGIELGNFLIKRVVKEVLRTSPNIRTFCTISPIPGLAKWLFTKLEMHIGQSTDKFRDLSLLTPQDMDVIRSIAPDEHSPYEALKSILSKQQAQQTPLPPQLHATMLRLAAKYLYREKRRDKVIDSVANFHIRNGARMYRVNLDADLSKLRVKESFGIMINYEYVLSDIESNNQAYLLDGTVRTSEQFLSHLEV